MRNSGLNVGGDIDLLGWEQTERNIAKTIQHLMKAELKVGGDGALVNIVYSPMRLDSIMFV